MGRKPKFAKEKYEEDLKNRINYSLRKDFSDMRLQLVTVTKVELTSDFSYATVYWDTHDNHKRGDSKNAVDNIASKMRSILASVMNVRHVPELKFIYDSQYDDELKITQLLIDATSEK